jgi:hypothetical protein
VQAGLAICAADVVEAHPTDRDGSTSTDLIKLTVNEIRQLIDTRTIRPIRDLAHPLALVTPGTTVAASRPARISGRLGQPPTRPRLRAGQ